MPARSPDASWDVLARTMADLRALSSVLGLLGWDRETYMPEGGEAARGQQMATLEAVAHESASRGLAPGGGAEGGEHSPCP